MRPGDLLRLGCVNLWRKRSRTILTTLSMSIGVMCIIVLVSVGLGYEQSYRESVEAMGSLTKIDVTPGDSLGGRTALLNARAVEAFRSLEGVEAVTPVLQQPAYLKSGSYVTMVRLYGMDMATAESFLLTPAEGELPEAGPRLRPAAMLTDDVAASFAIPGGDWAAAVDVDGNPLVDPLAAPIRLTFDYTSLAGAQRADSDGRALPGGRFYPLRVTGLCSTLNYTFSTSAFLDFNTLEELLRANSIAAGGEEGTYSLVWVKVRDVDDVQRIASVIRDAGLNTYSLNDMLETVRTQSRQIQGMLGAIGAVAMLVSAICVANTMMMSITERTREVGVLKVLGTSLQNISAMFLTEALIVGVLGGLGGLALSFLMKSLLPTVFAAQEVRSVIPLWLAVGGVAFAGAAAVLAALLPARRAMRISPNEAIRAQ